MLVHNFLSDDGTLLRGVTDAQLKELGRSPALITLSSVITVQGVAFWYVGSDPA